MLFGKYFCSAYFLDSGKPLENLNVFVSSIMENEKKIEGNNDLFDYRRYKKRMKKSLGKCIFYFFVV